MYDTVIAPGFLGNRPLQHFAADGFPFIHPVDWLNAHFAVGGWSPLRRLSGMLTAHVTMIAPRSGFTWHPHRGLEIYTWMLEGTLHHEDTTGGMGDIRAGELQRMFSGDWIEHQELNQTDRPVRLIQIWFAADPKYRGLAPHYQQLARSDLTVRREGPAEVADLIGGDSAMEAHAPGRVTATSLPAGGQHAMRLPHSGEDLFLYVTGGGGHLRSGEQETPLGQYDVVLARPDAPAPSLAAGGQQGLSYLSFYLPRFLS